MKYRKVALLLFSVLISARVLAQTPSCSVASKFYSRDSIIVTTFGASTVAGVNGFSFQPYLKQNFEYCYTGKTVVITNYGIYGQTTTQGLARFQPAIAGKTGFVCILMGVNDALNLYINVSQLPTTQQANKVLATTQTNMEDMLQMCLSNNLVPIIGTIQYVNDRNVPVYKTVNAFIKRINAGYVKLVQKYKGKAYLADINSALGRDFSLFQPDGLHPNAQGDKIISYVWFDAINEAIENKLLLMGLDQNYPNPARTNTTVGFSLSQPASVDIELYNMLGKPMKSVTNGFYNSGYHQVQITVNDMKPGIYVYVMKIAGRELTKKMIVVS